MAVLLLILGIILFLGLVIVHEMGHFLMARRNGVDAEEFGIFFPPKIWSTKVKGKKGRKSFEFSINALPLGGFVRLKGEHDSDTEPGTFGAANTWVKTKIMAAGVGMNLLTALVLFMILAWVGMPQLVDNQFTVKSDTTYVRHASHSVVVTEVLKGSPAAKAGLKTNDTISAVAGVKTHTIDQLHVVTKTHAGQTVTVEYSRDGKTRTTQATLHAQAKDSGYLGVGIGDLRQGVDETRSTWSAPVVAAGVTTQFTALTLKGLWTALKGVGGIIAGAITVNHAAREASQTSASSQVSGPVGIFVILKDGSKLGYQFMLMIVAVISLSLAIMNVLPIPALDGGKLFLTFLARVLRRRLTEQFEAWVYGGSFALLLLLIGIITLVDVKRFF